MARSKTTKRALVASVCATLMCIAMLIGTTFAWFTDTASTSVNKIQSGTLDVELYYANNTTGGDGTEWTKITSETTALNFVKASAASEGEAVLWEPGCTYSLPALKIKNEGNLALKYKVLFNAVDTSDEDLELAKVLDVTMNGQPAGTLYDVLTSTDEDGYAHGTLEGNAETSAITLSVKMRETAGNEYQNLTIGGIAVTVVATQLASEYDSTTNQYDTLAQYPVHTVADVKTKVEDGATKVDTAVTINSTEKTTVDGTEVSVATATIPANVVLETGTTQVTLVVENSTDSNNISITSDQAKKTLEVKLVGVSDSNTVPATVSYYIEKGLTGLKLYHNSAEMTSVASENAVSANNTYYYNFATGKVTMAVQTFSPFTYVYNAPNTATVTTRADLEKALSDTTVTTIKLGSDIACPEDDTSAIEVLRDVTIDFNGYVLGIGLNSGTTTHGGSSANLILTDSTNSTTSGIQNKIVQEGSGYKQIGAIAAWQNKVTINGGKYTHDRAVIHVQLQNTGGSDTVVVNGGTFEGIDTATVLFNDFGTLTINDGTFKAGLTEDGESSGVLLYVGYGSGYTGSITNINGGNFSTDNCLFYVNVNSSYSQHINISGGNFTITGEDKTFIYVSSGNAKDYITITGGTFNVDPSAYVADGYTATKSGDVWTVSKAA